MTDSRKPRYDEEKPFWVWVEDGCGCCHYVDSTHDSKAAAEERANEVRKEDNAFVRHKSEKSPNNDTD